MYLLQSCPQRCGNTFSMTVSQKSCLLMKLLSFHSLLNKRGKPFIDVSSSFVGAHVNCTGQTGDGKDEDGGWLHVENSSSLSTVVRLSNFELELKSSSPISNGIDGSTA